MSEQQTQPLVPVFRGLEEAETYLVKLERQAWEVDSQAQTIRERTEAILKRVREEGDEALYSLAEEFGDTLKRGDSLVISKDDWDAACERVPAETRAYLDEAARNIRCFSEAIMVESVKPTKWTHPATGYIAELIWKPVDKVACYVPGGHFPLASTVLMTAIPAQAAGVQTRTMCCPNPTDEMLYAARQAGIHSFFKTGGAQAVAAFAFGTDSLPAVDMVVGPGNAYVTEAKRQLMGQIGIDSLAGPSEVTILADNSANPDWLAADMLAQAEHSPDARSVLITTEDSLVEPVLEAINRQVNDLELSAFVRESSLPNSAIIVLEDWDACCKSSDRIAPEHLQLHLSKPEPVVEQLTHYGTLFIGELATVPFGDYAAGPNHTLPTNRTARFSGALSPLTFLKPQQTLKVSRGGAEYLAGLTEPFAKLEGLTAHAYAASLRNGLNLA